MKYKNHIIVLLSGIILIFFFFYIVVPCIIMPWMGLPPERIPTNTVFASEEYQISMQFTDDISVPNGKLVLGDIEENIYVYLNGSNATFMACNYNLNMQGATGDLYFEGRYKYYPEKKQLVLKVGIPNPWGESYRKIILTPSEA